MSIIIKVALAITGGNIMKIRYIAVLAAALLGSIVHAQAETTLRLLSSFPSNVANVQYFESVFIKLVAEQSGGDIKIVRSGPEVVPPFEQLQPVSSGVFDLLFSTASYSQSQSGVLAVIDSLTTDIEKLRSAGAIDWINDYYRKRFNVILLGTAPTPPNHFILKAPLPSAEGGTPLAGLKVRANAAWEGIVRALGGAPVNMAPGDVYAAMQKGVVDGLAWPIHMSAQFKLYEVGKYMTRPGFGHSNNVLLVNTNKFNALTEKQRKILIDAALMAERGAKKDFVEEAVRQDAEMEANGVRITEFRPAVAASLNRLNNEGNYQTARRSDAANVDKFWDFAKSKGLFEE
jgi:TRAP-type transport system periplasmic protein